MVSFFLFTSCIKEADEVKVPTSLRDMKIIVRGLVDKNEIKIYVSQTLPFFNKNGYSFDQQYIDDARVTISDGKDTLELPYRYRFNPEIAYYGYFGMPFDFRAGLKLYLNVDLPDGRHVDAVTIVPDDINVTVTKSDSMYIKDQWIFGYNCINNSLNSEYALGHYEYYLYNNIFIEPLKDTVYRISSQSSYRIIYNMPDHPYFQSYSYRSIIDRAGAESITYRKYNYLQFFSFNKGLKEYNFRDMFSDPRIDRPSGEPIYSGDSTDAFQEPLFSEPIYYNYYSNINGGLGFFEAYQEKIVYLE